MSDLPGGVKTAHRERIQTFLDKMEDAMRGFEDWPHGLEIEVAMQSVYHAWGLLHSSAIYARSVAEEIDAGMQAIWVPRGTAVQVHEYAKTLKA